MDSQGLVSAQKADTAEISVKDTHRNMSAGKCRITLLDPNELPPAPAN